MQKTIFHVKSQTPVFKIGGTAHCVLVGQPSPRQHKACSFGAISHPPNSESIVSAQMDFYA